MNARRTEAHRTDRATRSNRIVGSLPLDLTQSWLAPTGLLTAQSSPIGPFRVLHDSTAIAQLPITASVVAFDRGGRKVAAATPGGSIWVIDLPAPPFGFTDLRRTHSTEIKGAGSNVSALAFSPDAKLLAGGNSDRQLFVWNLETGKMDHVFGGNAFAIQQIAFTPDGQKITTLAVDGTVRVYWLNLDQLKAHARKLLSEWPD